MTKVVITGVSGSLGRFLAEDFLARGYEVIGMSRTNPEISGVEHIAHDLNEEFVGTLDPQAAVINCAAITRDGNSRALEQANLAITQNALRLTRGPFVHVSTSSVYDLRGPSICVEESAATGEYGFLNSYSRSKFATEKLVSQQASGGFVILRPHALIGPTDQTLGPRVRRAIRNGKLYLPGSGSAKHEFTSFTNFAEAIHLSLMAMANGSGLNRPINVSNGVSTSIRDAIKTGLGADNPEIRNLPLALAWSAASLAEALAAPNAEPRISRYQIAQLAFDRSYNLDTARELLGYEPKN